MKCILLGYLKLEIDNNKFNQNITNIQLDEMFTTLLLYR